MCPFIAVFLSLFLSRTHQQPHLLTPHTPSAVYNYDLCTCLFWFVFKHPVSFYTILLLLLLLIFIHLFIFYFSLFYLLNNKKKSFSFSSFDLCIYNSFFFFVCCTIILCSMLIVYCIKHYNTHSLSLSQCNWKII